MIKRLSLFLVLLALIALPACSALQNDSSSSPDAHPASASSGPGQPEVKTQTFENPNYYYDFGDILVPRELSFQSDESYVFDTRSFKAGVMVFTGRVDNNDLINFFINNMSKDGWTVVTTIKGERSVLIFEKFNKSASVQIQAGFKSKVTVFAVEAKGGPGSSMQPGVVTPQAQPMPQNGGTTGGTSGSGFGSPRPHVQEQELR